MKLMTLLLLLCTSIALNAQEAAKETIVVYNRNLENAFVKESINNAAQLSLAEFGDYQFVPSKDMEQGDAFRALVNGKIDIFIGSPNKQREAMASIIYIPIDRGLLGFRLCLVHNDAPKFTSINSVAQFVNRDLSVGLGEFWPDRGIYEENGFRTVTSPLFENLFTMLADKKFDCFSRSVNEISSDLDNHQNLNIDIDQQIVMIYPNADFIFVNPNKPELLKRFSKGMKTAVENKSYYDIFDNYFKDTLEQHRIYERKLIFLMRNEASYDTLKAINRYGIASFLMPPVN